MSGKKNKKRELILDMACELFRDKGFQGTKIIDISKAAGIGKSTVYDYFDSKEEIICELFKTRGADPYRDLPRLIDKEKTCEDKIKAYAEFELDHTGRTESGKHSLPGVFIRTDFFQYPVLAAEIRKLTDCKFSIVRGIVEEGTKKGEFLPVNPLLAAAFIMETVDFFAGFNWDLLPPARSLEMEQRKSRSKEELYRFLLGGIKKRNELPDVPAACGTGR